MFLTFDGHLQACQGVIPLAGDPVEAAARLFELPFLDFPQALSAYSDVADEAGTREDVEMLGDGLPGDFGAGRKTCDGQWAAPGETRYELEACLVAEGGEDEDGVVEARAVVRGAG
jgi:hypothetical protein